MKSKFKMIVTIEGDCDGDVSADDLIRLFTENVVMYFPDDGSVKPIEMEDSIFVIADVLSCWSHQEWSECDHKIEAVEGRGNVCIHCGYKP